MEGTKIERDVLDYGMFALLVVMVAMVAYSLARLDRSIKERKNESTNKFPRIVENSRKADA